MLENQRDDVATKAAKFYSRKSYVSFAGHIYLHGEKDHHTMRWLIFERVHGMCQTCPVPHYVPWTLGEWHHTQKTFGGRRCDGPCCGVWSCETSHPKPRVQWTRKNDLQPE